MFNLSAVGHSSPFEERDCRSSSPYRTVIPNLYLLPHPLSPPKKATVSANQPAHGYDEFGGQQKGLESEYRTMPKKVVISPYLDGN